jgi:NAD dependent epimerase/dehydratase family enzyme
MWIARVHTYLWDVNKGEIDEHAVDGVDVIVHLAGANVADGRWTNERKKEIIRSRTKSIELIYKLMREKNRIRLLRLSRHRPQGYYGDRADELLTEDSAPGTDFLANVCLQWEHAVDLGESLGLRIVKLRTGVVLDADGGALSSSSQTDKVGIRFAIR